MKTIHSIVERNRVTEIHESVTRDGPQRTEHVIREDHVASLIDEDGRVLMSRVCASADEATEFLKSPHASAVCEGWHGKDFKITHEDIEKPSAKFKAAARKIK